jgi:hypothetical protein
MAHTPFYEFVKYCFVTISEKVGDVESAIAQVEADITVEPNITAGQETALK